MRRRDGDCPPITGLPRIPCVRDNILVLKHQCETGMTGLTITLSEARYRALKVASAERGKSIGQLIDESLEFFGIKLQQDACDLVRRARTRANLTDERAMDLAQKEVRAMRRKL